MESNIFISFLNLLKIKHTRFFSSRFFNEHPHKYNLYGISSMLTDYGIENAGIRVQDKNDIYSIETPFIAHTGSEFVVVEKIFTDEIQFFERDKRIKVPLGDFFKIWTGIILVAEPGQNSVEPEYGIHFREELFNILRKIAIFAILIFLFAIAFISDKSYLQPGLLLLLVISLSGIYIDYLLLLKQLHIQNSYADRLCSLFKYSDCNNILESDDAKLFGVLSWSEVGMGYFISNTIILCFLPSFIPCLLFINIFCLPYSVWSIWYQKFKAKQWCPLCLGTMLLLWGIFITGMVFGYTRFSSVNFSGLAISCSIYVISILIINVLVPIIGRSTNLENIQYEINSIKANEDVFAALLRKQPRYG